ncbi:hypothetical protein WM00_36045 [Burkholderia cepacia]|nr:hypothetical protein WM00_36045 [Burkholderia cepacia]
MSVALGRLHFNISIASVGAERSDVIACTVAFHHRDVGYSICQIVAASSDKRCFLMLDHKQFTFQAQRAISSVLCRIVGRLSTTKVFGRYSFSGTFR